MNAVTLAHHLPTFQEIVELETLMLASDRQVEIKTTHYFAPGLYAREIFIPEGVAIVGHIHKTEHVCTVAKGRLLVASELGQAVLEAGHTFVSPRGIKRCGFALEDTVFVTYHPTTETELDKIEDHFLVRTEAEFLQLAREVHV